MVDRLRSGRNVLPATGATLIAVTGVGLAASVPLAGALDRRRLIVHFCLPSFRARCLSEA
jgi:hypothetical protein